MGRVTETKVISAYQLPPCKSCISFAICIGKEPLRCELLYDYIGVVNKLRPYQVRRLNKYTDQFLTLQSLFGKKIREAFMSQDGKISIYWWTKKE